MKSFLFVERRFHRKTSVMVALHSAAAKVTIRNVLSLQQRERQRERLYSLYAMNPSYVNAINSKLCLYSKPSQLVRASSAQSRDVLFAKNGVVRTRSTRKVVGNTSSTCKTGRFFHPRKKRSCSGFQNLSDYLTPEHQHELIQNEEMLRDQNRVR